MILGAQLLPTRMLLANALVLVAIATRAGYRVRRAACYVAACRVCTFPVALIVIVDVVGRVRRRSVGEP